MLEQGIVEKIEQNLAIVKIYKNGSCEDCTLCDSGGRPDERILKVNNSGTARVGDMVEVRIPSGTVIKSAMMIFFLPVAALITGYFFGSYVGSQFGLNSEPINILSGVLFTGLSLISIRLFDRKMSKNGANLPRIVKVLYSSQS